MATSSDKGSDISAEGARYKHLPADHAARSTKAPWYHEDFEDKLTPRFRELLEGWSGIAPEDVVGHIYQAVSLDKVNEVLALIWRTARK